MSGLLDWYGTVTERLLLRPKPTLAHAWLNLGFGWTRWHTAQMPSAKLSLSGQIAARVCFETVGRAFAGTSRMVVTSIFLPTEIFQTLGLTAITAEAIAGSTGGAHSEQGFVESAECMGIPESYCSYHKVLLGMAQTGVLRAPALLASCTVACDANNLTFKTLGDLWGSPHVYIDVPYEQSHASVVYVAQQLRELAHVAEELAGKKLDIVSLGQRVTRSQRSLACLDSSLPARSQRYLKGTMLLALEEMLDCHISLGTSDVELLARQILTDCRNAPHFAGSSLVWVHTVPFFLPEFARHLENTTEAQIAACDLLFDQICPEGFWYDGATQPFEAMAERMVRNSLNGPASRRAERIHYIAKKLHADGVVIFCHWGCRQTSGASQFIRNCLENEGLPVLVLDGDGCDRANNMVAQMNTRFEAFLELLRARRQAGIG